MSITLTATQVKASILALLDEVAAGEEVEITSTVRSSRDWSQRGGRTRCGGAVAGMARSAVPDEGLFGTGERWDVG